MVNFSEKHTHFTYIYSLSRKLGFENYAKIAAGLKATKVIGKSPLSDIFHYQRIFS